MKARLTNDKVTWNNQACARCGVTAELHGSCKIGGSGPMEPRCECDTFVWGEEQYREADQFNREVARRFDPLQTQRGAAVTLAEVKALLPQAEVFEFNPDAESRGEHHRGDTQARRHQGSDCHLSRRPTEDFRDEGGLNTMTNIIMIARGRDALTTQAVTSVLQNTPADQFNLTLVLDGEDASVRHIVDETPNAVSLLIGKSRGIVGLVRNIGAAFAEQYWGPSEYICFLDNDVWVEPRWLGRMIHVIEESRMTHKMIGTPVPCHILGGQQHPFHGTNNDFDEIHEVDAVAGYSLFMRWKTWKRYGPFAANQPGIGASEDFDLCQRVIKDHGHVGYVHPNVLWHCGITNSDGKPATGADVIPRKAGLIYL